MNNYLLLAACFLFGIILRRSGRLPDNAAAALNGFVINISLPALTLKLRANWRNPEDVKASYPKTSILKAGRVVFNIKVRDSILRQQESAAPFTPLGRKEVAEAASRRGEGPNVLEKWVGCAVA